MIESKIALEKLNGQMFRGKTRGPLSVAYFGVETNPEELLRRLEKSSLRDMLLLPGESLSIPHPDDICPDLGLIIGESPATGVSLSYYERLYRRYITEPNGPKMPPFEVIERPGGVEWIRKFGINIWYGKGGNKAAQILSLLDASRNAGLNPQAIREIYAPIYAETGYEGHNYKSRLFQGAPEIMLFLGIVQELFEKREQ